MQFNPIEDNNENSSKKKFAPFNTIQLPLCALNACMKNLTKQYQGTPFTQIVVLARIINIKVDRGKLLLLISDQTACTRMIQSTIGDEDHSQLIQNCYYWFNIILRQDNDQFIAYSQHYKKVQNYNAINFHYLLIMQHQIDNKNK